MKVNILFIKCLVLVVFFAFMTTAAFTQCEPMSPEECPDPENNGEICPDTMPDGFLNQAYSEEATILVPEEYGTGIVLHHITLAAIDNLPQGLSWESNAVNNEFMAGNYYCIVIEGTPAVIDTFYLKIVIDIYLDVQGQPVFLAQVVDSTSLSMIIYDENGLDDITGNIKLAGNYPNPFSSWTNISILAKEAGQMSFEVYSFLGEKVHSRDIIFHPGENNILFNGDFLPAGTYCYLIRSRNFSLSGLMIKTN